MNRLKNANGGLSGGRQRSATMAGQQQQQQQQQPPGRPHHLRFQLDSHHRTLSNISDDSISSAYAARPKSPGSNMASVFDGKSSTGGAASSITSYSPAPSPRSPKWTPMASNLPRPVPMAIDVRRANAAADVTGMPLHGSEIPISDPAIVEQVSALEEELREVSSELAASIRREMELEDVVDRLREEGIGEVAANRGTSDYFSDTGTNSTRVDHEELERLQRKAEQDKAQLRLRLTQKIQHERLKRKALEEQVRRFDEQGGPKAFEPKDVTGDAFGRIKQLEATLEETRRRLMEERRMKENYEDLLTALRAEIEEYRNERDNLRDEVVPRLRARVEGLESESAEFQRLTYEHSRTQQELQSLREELASQTATGRRGSINQQQPPPTPVFDAIAEEDPSFADPGLARSLSKKRSSVAGPSSRQRSLTRSNSTRDRESRESLADRVKDVEAQRDALHRALRGLLDRHELQTREHDKRVKALETERDRLLLGSPRKGYNREVSNLREEINHLRRRADEALEQKWQCEKGLGGLKMDLDRAEQETSSLRMLLQEHDILIPESSGSRPSSQNRGRSGSVTSASLEKAYRELQTTHALALARIQALEGGGDPAAPLETANVETERTMELLKKSIVDAEAERDVAQRQAEEFRLQAESLREAGKGYMDEEHSLSEQLRASAVRVEELAVQVRQQLDSNNQLRHRLAEAIARGERQQKSSAARITEMQGKLKALEDHLTAAQAHSEDTIARHEEEVREIRESHNAQLQRMKNGFKRWSGSHKSGSVFSPIAGHNNPNFPGTRNGSVSGNGPIGAHGNMAPMSPLFTSGRSPRLDLTTTGVGMSLPELSRADMLEHRVQDLERALGDADREMEEVVSRMNLAQIEVMELQSQR